MSIRILYVILAILVIVSCNNKTDREYLIQTFDQNHKEIDFDYELDDGNVTRYDDKGYTLDKHWFDEMGNLTLYTFYNRFYNTGQATCKIRFNNDQKAIDIEGQPFYVSSNLIHNDTIIDEKVKAYIYLANSPFLNTKIIISTNVRSSNQEFLVVEEKPTFVVYFEDTIDSSPENRVYNFVFGLDMKSLEFQDTIRYNCYVSRFEIR